MVQQSDFTKLLDKGVHFGHLKKKWNPNMAPYILMERNNIHIIDINKTIAKLNEATSALTQIAKSGKKILFVATKKQAKDIISEKLKEVSMPYVTERWFGGMLTNFPTIRKAIKKMQSFEKMKETGTFDHLSKKEKLQISRQRLKLERNLGSITDMTKLPAAIFIIDVLKEKIAINEAKRLGIPIFGVVDTNSDPTDIDFVIPANDDAVSSISLIMDDAVEAIHIGLEERKKEKMASKDNNKDKDVQTKTLASKTRTRKTMVRKKDASLKAQTQGNQTETKIEGEKRKEITTAKIKKT